MGQILDKLYVLDRIGVCHRPSFQYNLPLSREGTPHPPPSFPPFLLDTNKYNAVTGNIIGSLEELIAPLFRG